MQFKERICLFVSFYSHHLRTAARVVLQALKVKYKHIGDRKRDKQTVVL